MYFSRIQKFFLGISVAVLLSAFLISPKSFLNQSHLSSQILTQELSDPLARYFKLPLHFEENHGQTSESVKFLTRGHRYTFYFTPQDMVMDLRKERDMSYALRMQFVNSNPTCKLEGVEELEGKAHYFIGKDSKKWLNDISNFSKIIYQNIYPGIDVVFYGNQQQLEYDIMVSPGSDPQAIRMKIDGSKNLAIDDKGNLNIVIDDDQNVYMKKPIIYQLLNGEKEYIEGKFILLANNEIGFSLGHYDPNKEVIIDPVFEYSTYLGGTGIDQGFAIAVDSSGNAYVTGLTTSLNFPTTVGAFQTALAGIGNAFVTKLNSSGSALIFSTYLGGEGIDQGNGIAVDSSGNSYIVGQTNSTTFPTTVGAFQTALAGGTDAFITKLNPTGSALVYSTYLGGSSTDIGNGIAIDENGNAFVTGQTGSPNFPVSCGFQTVYGGGTSDAFVTALNSTGTALVYSTFLGGSAADIGFAIALDDCGNAYVTGQTASANFPTTAGAFQTALAGGTDVFITKLHASGSFLIYSTYLGGASGDSGRGIAVNSNRNAYVTGFTLSSDFPVTPGAFQTALAGTVNAFVTELNTQGTGLVFSTYLGGNFQDFGFGIALDTIGNSYVTGQVQSANFPTTPGAFQTALAGNEDAFITKLNTSGTSLIYSSYLGGLNTDIGHGIAVDTNGSAYIVGETDSTNFPVTAGAFQTAFAGVIDAFISKFAIGSPIVTGIDPHFGPTTGGTIVTITGTGFSNATSVQFGATPAASFIIDSNTQITAVSPPGVGSVHVTVTSIGGTSPNSQDDLFTYIPAKQVTITTLTVAPNPSIVGQTVTLTANVSPNTATGTVSFFDGVTLIGTTSLLNGIATLEVNNFTAGNHTITAVYAGDNDFLGSTSNAVVLVVNPEINPPRNLRGVQKATHFATQTDYINILTWKSPSSGSPPVEYRIFRDKQLTKLVAIVPADEELKFKDHNRQKGKRYTYFIVSVDQAGNFSVASQVTVKSISH